MYGAAMSLRLKGMYSEPRTENIDTRWVFRAYAALAGLGGFLLLGWGPLWLGTDLAGEPWGKAALIRVFGSIMIGAACCTAPFALHGDPTPRRGLFWFATAHLVVFNILLLQHSAVWGEGLGRDAMQIVGIVAFLLWIAYAYGVVEDDSSASAPISLFGEATPRSAVLRSRYEQQIREAARQEERNRLARDLHDSIKQQIFVIQTAAATAQARFDDDQAGTREALDQVRNSAREAMTEMQVMLEQLRAVPLENSGLIESLRKQCEALGFRTGAKVEFTLGDLPGTETLAPGAHEALLRVAQEALANIGRHARAATVQVSLGSVYGQVELRIRDDGSGFDPNVAARGQGLGNMHARAAEFGGKFELISSPGSGTTVVFSVPYAIRLTRQQRRRNAALVGVLMVAAIQVLVWKKSMALSIVSTIALIGITRMVANWLRTRHARHEAAR